MRQNITFVWTPMIIIKDIMNLTIIILFPKSFIKITSIQIYFFNKRCYFT